MSLQAVLFRINVETVFTYICEHSQYAYIILFSLILLSGLCIPISEDIMLLISGGIASRCIPDQALSLYVWIFFACWISAWEAYWIGRILGPRLFNIPWFNRFVTQKKLEKLKEYYQRFGIFTFLVGRFIPGGVRNAIFLTSGLTEIPFKTFVIKDGIACLIATATIFSIGFLAGEHLSEILASARLLEIIATVLLVIIVIVAGIMIYRNQSKTKGSDNSVEEGK